jgi:HSP20 family protein
MKTQNNLPIRSFSDAIDSIFNTSFPNFLGSDFFQTQPAVNFSESDDAYHIEMAVPGVKKEDITINIKNDVITITGESKETKKEDGPEMKRREYNYSSFTRSFTIPEDVDANKIQAKQENGVLILDLAKQETIVKEGIKKIEIS